MSRLSRQWRLGRAAGLLAILSLLTPAGCTIALNLFNPNLLQSLGVDASIINPPRGTVIAALQNRTDFRVEFELIYSTNSADITLAARSPTSEINAGGDTNEVLSCPVRLLALGFVNDDGSYNNTAAFVFEDEDTVMVPFTGSILSVDRDFNCGDVIRFTLEPAPPTDGGDDDDGEGEAQNNYRIIVEVIPTP